MSTSLDIYLDYLTHLRTSYSGKIKAPHKAILMLTITEMVREGIIKSPVIYCDDLLKHNFIKNWRKYIQIQTSFVGDVKMPFSHIGSEKFVISNNTDKFEIDKELFRLMHDPEYSSTIISSLISTYLSRFAFQHKIDFDDLNPYKDYNIERLSDRWESSNI